MPIERQHVAKCDVPGCTETPTNLPCASRGDAERMALSMDWTTRAGRWYCPLCSVKRLELQAALAALTGTDPFEEPEADATDA